MPDDTDLEPELESGADDDSVENAAATREFVVTSADVGDRLDRFLSAQYPETSRSQIARNIKEGNVVLSRGAPLVEKRTRSGMTIEAGDTVRARITVREAPNANPEPIELEILFEDDHLLAIHKRAGLTVHPGHAQPSGTMANALAHHFQTLSSVSGPLRPGIVHRLDRETSGVILVAKDDHTHHLLADQFRERTVKKEYRAVVKGVVEFDEDIIDEPLGPNRRHPTRMAIRHDVGRASQTRYRVLERYRQHTYVACFPRTGRTHQIRVHMASIRHPIVSDRLYGGIDPDLREVCPRQALHARRITFTHPRTGHEVTFEAPIPADIEALLATLRARESK